MVKEIIVTKKITDKNLEKKEGEFFSGRDYKIMKEDCDVYYYNNDKSDKKLLLSFRKGVIPNKICVEAYNALEKEAKIKHNNRGAAAGKLDLKKLPNYVKKTTKKTKFRTYYVGKDGTNKKDHLSNYVSSGILGYYDKPDRNLFNPSNINNNNNNSNTKIKISRKRKIPTCRTTKFTRDQVEKWDKCLPLLKEADKQFKKLVPDRHKTQLIRAKKTPKFQIKNTAFSTITINYNFRTALHKDKGDLEEGFGNLLVLEKSKSENSNESHDYSGGYLCFPQFKIGVDVRQGDFLAMDVHQFHTNTKINSLIKGKNNYGRLSIVCYLRKNMIKCVKKK